MIYIFRIFFSDIYFAVTDERRRVGRRGEDNRRHTLNTNEMMVYAQNQNQQPQRTMDLEVVYY